MFSRLPAILALFAGVAAAQYNPPGVGSGNFQNLGIGGRPEQGAIFEVRTSGAAITATSGYVPGSIFKAADGGDVQQISVISTDYSTDLGDALNIYQVGANGSVHFDVGFGGIGPNGVDIVLAPADGSISIDGASLFVSLTGATGAVLQQTHNFGGTGVSTKQSLLLKSFPDPDGNGTTASQLEVFATSINDATGHQTGTGTNYVTAGRDGTSHGGYREGVNAVYSDANTFTSNGWTLFDYADSENIMVASTVRPHTLIFPAPIFPIVTATTVSGLGTCASIGEGAIKPVTDSNTNTWGATVASGGALHILAYCDGTNWTVIGK